MRTPPATLPQRTPGAQLPIDAPPRYVGRAKIPLPEGVRIDDAAHLTIHDLERLRDAIRDWDQMAGSHVPPLPGEFYALSEESYRYGVGPVLVRIVTVNALLPYHGEPWWQVTADYTLGTPERHAPGWRPVEFYLRAEGLASALIQHQAQP